ncbi:MAG TPA: hypothetical protein DHU96_17860 [Actinobacteria bacterium]|nr:hypothetical protein [Actinomycetota bacterium]
MPDAAPTAEQTAARMRAIADGLAAASLDTHLRQTRASADFTAITHTPAGREMEAVIDEDGYTELRFWNTPGATPAHICAVIIRALAAISAAQRS